MRGIQVIGGSLLILALGAADDAEARGRGGFRGASRSVVMVSTGSGAVAAVRSGSASASIVPNPALRPIKPVLASPAPVREVRAAEPWCAQQRVVGSGSGFCIIN